MRGSRRDSRSEQAVEIIGFHSARHRGVFTPRDANAHMHVRTRGGRVSGHLDAIALAPRARIRLPGQEEGT
jgi:hypothetical protein